MNNINENIELNIKEIINSKIAFDEADGDKLLKEIINVTKDNSKTVILNFNDIDLVNIAFLNNAIGKLFYKSIYNIERNKVLIYNMDETKKNLLKEAVSGAMKEILNEA